MESLDSPTHFHSLILRARRLYAEGRNRHDVMRAVYGVDLPAEAYAFWSAYSNGNLDLPIGRMNFPWDLIMVENPGFDEDLGPWEREQEERAFAQVPRFLPLIKLGADEEAIHDDYIIGYDLDELSTGSTTILGHHGDFAESGAELQRLGHSLLDVLHTWITSYLHVRTEELQSPRNFGFGSIGQQDVDKVADMLHAIEVVQREVPTP